MSEYTSRLKFAALLVPVALAAAVLPARALPDFRGSTKDATPRTANIGDAVTYTLVITNSGDLSSNMVNVTDQFPDCLLVPVGWDPATEVTASPGPPSATPTYDTLTRILTVPFAVIPAAPAPGSTQTITITGLFAAVPSPPTCCNQGRINGTGIIQPGHGTDDVDPSLPGNADLTCITIRKSDFTTSTKTVSPATMPPGGGFSYTITINNTGSPDANVLLTDVFPVCVELPANWCPPAGGCPEVTVSPGPSGTPAYDPLLRTLTVNFPTFAAGPTTQTITINGLTGGTTPGACCNIGRISSMTIPKPGVPTDDPAIDVNPPDPTCMNITALASFAGSTKVIAPSNPILNDALTLTIDVTNSGGSDGNSVILTDALPSCMTIPPNWPGPLDVTVSPDSAAVVSFSPLPPTLQVDFSTAIPASGPGSTQTVTITGLTAGALGPCCNQGRITSNEVPSPGQATDNPATGTANDETCVTVTDVPVAGPGLLRDDRITALSPLSNALSTIFTGVPPGCPADPEVGLPPVTPAPACGSADGEGALPAPPGSQDGEDLYKANATSPYTDPDTNCVTDAGRPLIFYQVQGPASLNSVKAVKSGLPSNTVIVTFQ